MFEKTIRVTKNILNTDTKLMVRVDEVLPGFGSIPAILCEGPAKELIEVLDAEFARSDDDCSYELYTEDFQSLGEYCRDGLHWAYDYPDE